MLLVICGVFRIGFEKGFQMVFLKKIWDRNVLSFEKDLEEDFHGFRGTKRPKLLTDFLRMIDTPAWLRASFLS